MKYLAIILALSPFTLRAEPLRDGAFRGEFVTAKTAISPGETIDLALHILHDPGFHTYWQAPGIVGVPTEIKWLETSKLTPGDILWPQPQRLKMGPYDAYGYEGEVFLIVPLTAPADAKPGGTARLKARVSFMICPAVLSETETCYPGFIDLSIDVQIAGEPSGKTKWAAPIQAARDTFAKDNTQWEASAERRGTEAILTLKPKPAEKPIPPKSPYFYATDGQLHSDLEQEVHHTPDGTITLKMPTTEFGPKNPTHLTGIFYTLSGRPDGTGAAALRFSIPYSKP